MTQFNKMQLKYTIPITQSQILKPTNWRVPYSLFQKSKRKNLHHGRDWFLGWCWGRLWRLPRTYSSLWFLEQETPNTHSSSPFPFLSKVRLIQQQEEEQRRLDPHPSLPLSERESAREENRREEKGILLRGRCKMERVSVCVFGHHYHDHQTQYMR